MKTSSRKVKIRVKNVKTWSLVTVLAGSLLGLSGCGAEALWLIDEETDPAKIDLSDFEATPVPEEEKAKEIIERIEPQEELHAMLPPEYRAGLKWTTSVGYPPMELWASNNEDIIGVDPAMARAMSAALGVEMTLEDQEFNAMIPGLISGRYDVLASSMTDTEERRETTSFVSYVKSGNAFLVEKGNPLNVEVPEDLCGKKVALVDGGSSAAFAEGVSAECESNNEEPYEILRFEQDQTANLALESGRADATVTDLPVALSHASSDNKNFEAVPIDGDEAIWGIGIDNAQTQLAEAIQAAMQYLMDEGYYEEILAAWDVEVMAVDEATLNGG
ncbi:ABC transporter substrate-binding protein [Auritidibacter sp. NML130574]|uniref:ABC transporter substrate-binding protein n=1 Tax=Auritidibacter sp. NML130574 TaxID=2170745 RepID=UPI000D73D65E|nr:ABC transporter substrate-binding protein [Auritidibacter sp. NML130574]AXR74618.1 ABC transporter substrate-binding protein [Auritidibacter sp. NML130574]